MHQTPGKCGLPGNPRSHPPLEKLQIHYLIYSGCSAASAWASAPLVQKPATREHLIPTITDLLG